MVINLEKDERIKLPKAVITNLSLEEGAQFDCDIENGIIYLKPIKGKANDITANKKISNNSNIIQINCFERFSLFQNGDFIPITNKKAEELIAYLILEGKPVKKSKLWELLWPEADSKNARDSLYKVCRYLRNLIKSGIEIPLKLFRNEIFLDTYKIDTDIERFESLYNQSENISMCREAVELYTAPLLFDNYYDWTAQAEAYYDIRYCELVQKLIDYYKLLDNDDLVIFYQNKIK